MREISLTPAASQRFGKPISPDPRGIRFTGPGWTGTRLEDETYWNASRSCDPSFSYDVESCQLDVYEMPSWSSECGWSCLDWWSIAGMGLSSQHSDFPQSYGIWKWCPCKEDGTPEGCTDSMSWPESACPETAGNLCHGDWSGEGAWVFVSGNNDVGPPCVTGRFYGEAVAIAQCPYMPISPYLASVDYEFGGCDSLPGATLTGPNLDPDEDVGTASQLFTADDGGISAWSWCPCGEVPVDEPTQPDLTVCPQELDCGDALGDGYWLFRGGDIAVGPPCIVGRFYGELIWMGECCNSWGILDDGSSVLVESSVPIVPEDSDDIPGSCRDCDEVPWWEVNVVEDSVTVEDMPAPACTGWMWCPCKDETGQYEDCFPIYNHEGDCPQTDICDDQAGRWLPLAEGVTTLGPPCVVGRFYGEIVYICECCVTTDCPPGGVEVASIWYSQPVGFYHIAGWYNGMFYWYNDTTGFYLWLSYTLYFGTYTYGWVLSTTAPAATLPTDYFGWTSGLLPFSTTDPTGSYDGYGIYSGPGSVGVTCCQPCTSPCEELPATLTMTVSGLTGLCCGLNGTYTLTLSGCAEYGYAVDWISSACSGDDYLIFGAWFYLRCVCGGWYAYLGSNSVAVMVTPKWISLPKASQADSSPALGEYTVTWVVTADLRCDPAVIPTVVISA